MPLSVRLLTTSDVAGTPSLVTFYLTNSTNSPTPSGNPLVESQTPYSINARNWTPTAAPRQTIYSGNPPFRIGSSPILVGFGNVTETVEIGIAANTVNDMITYIHRLRRALNAAIIGVPAVLLWQPNNASNATAFEIYSADVQEVGDWQNPAAGFTNVLCRVTWTRSAFGGRLSAGETLFSLQSFGTSGGPSAVVFPTSQSGDLRATGQPTNLLLRFGTGTTPRRFFVGTVGVAATHTGPTVMTTTSTTGVNGVFISTATDHGLLSSATRNERIRIVGRFAFATGVANAEIRARIQTVGANVILWDGPWIDPNPAPGVNTSAMIDMGEFDPSVIRETNIGQRVNVVIRIRSKDGLSTTVTYNSSTWARVFTWCQVDIDEMNNADARVDAIYEKANRAVLPLAQPFVGAQLQSTQNLHALGRVRGQLPLYIEGASLLVAWGTSTGTGENLSIINPSANELFVSMQHAPLYHTMRGAG